MTLWEVAAEISRRLTGIFLKDADGARPVYGASERWQRDPAWRDHILFYECFNGDTGAGVGRQPPDRLDGARREAAAADCSALEKGGASSAPTRLRGADLVGPGGALRLRSGQEAPPLHDKL